MKRTVEKLKKYFLSMEHGFIASMIGIQREDIRSILVNCKASNTVSKEDIGLILDPYSANSSGYSFTMNEVDKLYESMMRHLTEKNNEDKTKLRFN